MYTMCTTHHYVHNSKCSVHTVLTFFKISVYKPDLDPSSYRVATLPDVHIFIRIKNSIKFVMGNKAAVLSLFPPFNMVSIK